jgi:hypothetical protein
MKRFAAFLVLVCLGVGRDASAELVTERWGQAGRCRHRGTADFRRAADGEGTVVRFDLSALPKGAAIYRARLLLPVSHGPGPLAEPILIQPLTARPPGAGKPAVEKAPLPLVGPRYRSFDATAVVRKWASGRLANHGLWVRRAPGWEQARTYLEISHEGKLTDPPRAVTGLRAFHRAGQVFLTFREVACPFAGKDDVPWDEMKAHQKGLAEGKVAQISYRVYRHSRQIVAANLHEAELLDEVPQFSAFDQRMIQTVWKGERIKNVRVGSARVPRVCIEPLKELPVGTGVFVRTSDRRGKFHYAVISVADGVENSTQINAENSLSEPLVETIARPEPILHHESVHIYDKPRPHRFYLLWADPPLSHTPSYYHLGVTSPAKRPEGPAPLYVHSFWWDNGWARSGARRKIEGCVSLQMETPWVLHKGVHEGTGTYKAFSQGKVQDYWARRLRNVLPWLGQRYHVDFQRMYAMSSDWAWHLPDLFAAVHENLTTDPKRSPTAIGSNRFWGKVAGPAETQWGVSAWKYYDIAWYARNHVPFEMPLVYYTPNMHLGDFGKIDKPRFYRAMLDTKRPFLAAWGMNVDASWIYRIRRAEPLAAFGNCSLDSNPGIGMDDGDREGQINGYLRFDSASAVDRGDRWEMTVWLFAGDERGRYGAPADSCTVDITPRRCRQFRPKPGQTFRWTNTVPPGEEGAKAVQTGTAVADRWGLVTARKVVVAKDKGRLVIERAK